MSANKPMRRIERDRLIGGMKEEREMPFVQGIPDNSSDDQPGDDQPVVKADLRNLESSLVAKINQTSTEFRAEITAARAEAKTDAAGLKADIGKLTGEITAARAEAKADIGKLTGDIGKLTGEITAARAEAKADIIAARAEAKADFAELKADIGILTGEITAARAEAKADVAELKADIKADIASMSMRVILGVTSMVLVVLVPILVLLFTLRPVSARVESGVYPSSPDLLSSAVEISADI